MVGVLTGSRVTLRAPRLDDAGELFASVASDPEVTRYMSWTPHCDVSETRRVITELFNVDDERTWLIQLHEGDIIGTCGFPPAQAPHSLDFGYCLGRRWWGRGLMDEAVGLLLTEMESDPDVFRVSAVCHVDNVRSARVLQRAGLSLDGRLTRHTVFPNLGPEPQDVLLWAKAVR
ncbi:GNAT family acetyltransferase [Mycobacterium sp. 1274761.0]|nr:GNAT family N-acetyltransferase [Mycobacterium sp. 1274761.0]OBK76030.1 GNAT family acetyltransferase [Mycobacterium sp. 1274761.0]